MENSLIGLTPPFSAKIMEKNDVFFFWILDHYLSTLETFFFFTPKIWEKWAFKNKNKKNYGISIIGLTPPPPRPPENQKNDVFFMDTRPLFEHFGDFFLFYP